MFGRQVIIYDNFTGSAGPLNTSPSASFWTSSIGSGDTARLDGNGNLIQYGDSPFSDILSTATFNTTTRGFQFKIATLGFPWGAFGVVYTSGPAAFWIRSDVGSLFRLYVVDSAGTSYNSAALTRASGDLWEISYAPSLSQVSAFRNGSLVASFNGITITQTFARMNLFQYGTQPGIPVSASYEYVATTN
jgi:hypothetical protein